MTHRWAGQKLDFFEKTNHFSMKVISEYFIRLGPPTSWVSKCLLTGNPKSKSIFKLNCPWSKDLSLKTSLPTTFPKKSSNYLNSGTISLFKSLFPLYGTFWRSTVVSGYEVEVLELTVQKNSRSIEIQMSSFWRH